MRSCKSFGPAWMSVRTRALFWLWWREAQPQAAVAACSLRQEVRAVAKHSVWSWSSAGVVLCQLLIYLQLAQKPVGVWCAWFCATEALVNSVIINCSVAVCCKTSGDVLDVSSCGFNYTTSD